MHASTFLGALALCGTAMAIPAATATDKPTAALLEKRAEPTAPWVTIDDEGQPVKTVTPSVTTVDGTTSIVNGAPHDLTASVYTWTTWGVVTTSTGNPPNPTATAKSGEGTFARCSNLDGENAPFCSPYSNSTLLTGRTYYSKSWSTSWHFWRRELCQWLTRLASHLGSRVLQPH